MEIAGRIMEEDEGGGCCPGEAHLQKEVLTGGVPVEDPPTIKSVMAVMWGSSRRVLCSERLKLEIA